MIVWSQFPDFSEVEFTCKCGCGETLMDEAYLFRLQSIRSTYAKPMVITSGYRCPSWNDQQSSTGRKGPHTTGRSSDIACRGADALRLMELGIAAGMTGFGLKQKGSARFIHLDDLADTETAGPRPWVWTY